MASISSDKVEPTAAVQSAAIDLKSSQPPDKDVGMQEKLEEQTTLSTGTDELPRLGLIRLGVLSVALSLGFFLTSLVCKPMLRNLWQVD